MGSISTREWIRWETDRTSSEPTSTLVLTSPGKRFVDIRILLQVTTQLTPVVRALDQPNSNSDTKTKNIAKYDPSSTAGIQQLAQLDWAFAGTSSSEIVKDDKGLQVVKSAWNHFVDSRFRDADKAADSGLMYPRPDGMTLEKGSMVNPATSKTETYEELWKDETPQATRKGGKVECSVLQLQDDQNEARGMVIKLGKFCQGVVRVGEQIALERWRFTEKDGWRRDARMGDLWLPCGVTTDHHRLELGGKVTYGVDEWIVVELSES